MRSTVIGIGAKFNLTQPRTLGHTRETTARKWNKFIMTADAAGKCKDVVFWVISTVAWGEICPKSYFVLITGSNISPGERAVWEFRLVFMPFCLTAQLQAFLCQNSFHPKPKEVKLSWILKRENWRYKYILGQWNICIF